MALFYAVCARFGKQVCMNSSSCHCIRDICKEYIDGYCRRIVFYPLGVLTMSVEVRVWMPSFGETGRLNPLWFRV